MKSIIVGMLAETFIHSGSGQNVGAIDLPVAREAATDYPYIAGSSLKGALRDAYEQRASKEEADAIMGKPEHAGDIVVSDARLLLLPVRSLTGAYKWVTCGHLLERFIRDCSRSGQTQAMTLPKVDKKHALSQGDGTLFLEERSFSITNAPEPALVDVLKTCIPHPDVAERLAERLVILHDDDFTWFARYGLAIQARNQLTGGKTSSPWKNPETGKTEKGNLWYEETLPPDTLMYTVLAERNKPSEGESSKLEPLLTTIEDYLQVGGNETVGQGWFCLKRKKVSDE